MDNEQTRRYNNSLESGPANKLLGLSASLITRLCDMNPMVHLFAIMLSVILAVSCSHKSPCLPPANDHESIVLMVKTAYRDGSDLPSTLRLVRREPTYSSLRHDGPPITAISLIHDDQKLAEISPYIHNCAEVAYWAIGQNDEHGNPRIIGIIWHTNGSKKLFLARVLPP